MKITKCIVVRQKYAADTIFVETDLPSACPKVSSQSLSLSTNHVEVGTGEAYCKRHFPGVEIEVVGQ